MALTATPFVTLGAPIDLVAIQFDDTLYLYIADFDAGLSIARSDNSAPGDLEMVSLSYVMPIAPLVRSVGAAIGQAFLAGSVPMLWTVDSKQPRAMTFIGSGNAMSTTVSAMQVHDNWLLAAGGTAGLLRYTIQEGAEPTDPESFTTGVRQLRWPWRGRMSSSPMAPTVSSS